MKKLFILLTAIMIAGTFQSCKKDSDSTSTDNKSILISYGWILTDIQFDGQSFWSFMDDCDKDNVLTFNANGTTTEEGGALKCDPNEVFETGTWEMINNTTVEIDGDILKIESISSSNMILSQTDSGGTSKLFFKSK
jgi:hypothetical protein